MDIKAFIQQTLKGRQIQINDLQQFLCDYCKLNDKDEPTALQLQQIIQLILVGVFDINYLINRACEKLNICVCRIYDKNGNLIVAYIEN